MTVNEKLESSEELVESKDLAEKQVALRAKNQKILTNAIIFVTAIIVIIVTTIMLVKILSTLEYISYDMFLMREKVTGIKDYPKEMHRTDENIKKMADILGRSAKRYMKEEDISSML